MGVPRSRKRIPAAPSCSEPGTRAPERGIVGSEAGRRAPEGPTHSVEPGSLAPEPGIDRVGGGDRLLGGGDRPLGGGDRLLRAGDQPERAALPRRAGADRAGPRAGARVARGWLVGQEWVPATWRRASRRGRSTGTTKSAPGLLLHRGRAADLELGPFPISGLGSEGIVRPLPRGGAVRPRRAKVSERPRARPRPRCPGLVRQLSCLLSSRPEQRRGYAYPPPPPDSLRR